VVDGERLPGEWRCARCHKGDIKRSKALSPILNQLLDGVLSKTKKEKAG
jgi:hypothetical protein